VLFNKTVDSYTTSYSIGDKGIGMQHWGNEAERGKTEILRQKPVAVPFLHYKFHMDWPEIEPRPLR
jgi:hypothetical protein